jgi:hypothetical protein
MPNSSCVINQKCLADCSLIRSPLYMYVETSKTPRHHLCIFVHIRKLKVKYYNFQTTFVYIWQPVFTDDTFCHQNIFFMNKIIHQKHCMYIYMTKSNWVDIKKKCSEILENFVFFGNISILMIHFISFCIVKETVLIGGKSRLNYLKL